jgi:D-alanine-D-alanine ligase-like ATP-grasp enzyme
MVRNLANGFVYVFDEAPPACVKEEAIKALESTGLAFGAVDVIYNQQQDKAYVLEINTAPGLEQRTAEAYALAFKEIV